MKVVSVKQVSGFPTGTVMDPRDVNRVTQYAADALEDVSGKRWAKSVVVLPFAESMLVGYNNGSAGELRTYRFTPPVTVVLERAIVDFVGVAGADVTLSIIQTSTGLPPTGASSPWLVVPTGATTAAVVNDINTDRITLVSGTEYQFTISGTSFTTSRCDLQLHLAVDRWWSAGQPEYAPLELTDEDFTDASVISSNIGTLTTETSSLATTRGLTCTAIVRHAFSSGTNSSLLRVELPRLQSTRLQGRIVRLMVVAHMPDTLGTTLTAEVRNQAGTLVGAATANVAGVTLATGDSGVIDIPLTTGAANATTTTSLDYSLRLVEAAGKVAVKAYAYCWIEWR